MQNSIKLILILFSLILFSSKSNAIISVNAKTAILQDYLSGEILYEKDADLSIYPASMTKIMTSIIAFDLIKKGELTLDEKFIVSENAWRLSTAGYSSMFIMVGDEVSVENLLRGIIVASGNDACIALAEGIAGTEEEFAVLMTEKALEIGMENTNFSNSSGINDPNNYSTVRDILIMSNYLIKNYPEYYHLFSRRTANAGIKKVRHTNTRFLANYRGADGIKTGFTSAAGYTLTASAERGRERIITTVFGGRSIATRNRQVAKLMDLGFKKAPTNVSLRKPHLPNYSSINLDARKIKRSSGAVRKSLVPKPRPGSNTAIVASVDLSDGIEKTLKMLMLDSEQPENVDTAQIHLASVEVKSSDTISSSVTKETNVLKQARLVSHNSSDEHKVWGVNVGRFGTRYAAEKMLIKTALAEMPTLGGSLRKVVKTKLGFEANFYGVSQVTAEQACRKLANRQITCDVINPSG